MIDQTRSARVRTLDGVFSRKGFGYTEVMSDEQTNPETEEVGTGPKGAESDVQSDPAEGEKSGDWSGEGGATEEGPATDND